MCILLVLGELLKNIYLVETVIPCLIASYSYQANVDCFAVNSF